MKGSVKIAMTAAAVLAAALVLARCSSGFKPAGSGISPVTSSPAAGSIKGPTNGFVQSNDAGSVTFDVRWSGKQGSSLVFDVAMDTHSVDLDGYDLQQLAVLRDDQGKELRPISWNAAAGGHHRSGKLTFPLPESVKQGQAEYVELVIRDVAGIGERVLKWQL